MKADRHRKEEGFAATDQNKADRAAFMHACVCECASLLPWHAVSTEPSRNLTSNASARLAAE